MGFELDAVFVQEDCRASALARRIVRALPPGVPVSFLRDVAAATRPPFGVVDQFSAGKRRMVIRRHKGPFLEACPAAAPEFACCGYLVMNLASNCPMDCSYCFLQEYLGDNPGFQIYANYADAFDELDRLQRRSPGRRLRVGTGELADSLAFDSITGMSLDLVEYASFRDRLTLELKTKTVEIENLLKVDPRGRVMVSWTLSPEAVYQSSEHRSAAPTERIAAALRVMKAGYRVAFHLDPIIAYPGAENDYPELIDELLSTVAPERIEFVSMGGLRMTPELRKVARRRFPRDPMLVGEEVLAPDGRYRAFTPLRLGLYRTIMRHLSRSGAKVPVYLCMESHAVNRHVLGPPSARYSAARPRVALA